MPKKMLTVLKISAKCSDLCSAVLVRNGKLIAESDGYVPSIMPNGGGDYVDIDIDITTGQILNWKVPTEAQVKAFIKGRDDDDFDENDEEEVVEEDLKAFDAEQGIVETALGIIDVWLCVRCREAETRKPTEDVKDGICDCCEQKATVRLYKIIT